MIKNAFAATKPIGGTLEGIGPLGKFDPNSALGLFSRVISIFIGVLTICAGLWFVFQFIFGAFGWITSGADKVAKENAQKKLTNAIVGLVIVIAAIFIVDLIGSLLGLEILNPGAFIEGIWSQ